MPEALSATLAPKVELTRLPPVSYNVFNTPGSDSFEIADAQKGIVYTPGGKVTIRTLRKLEHMGLIEILEDNSGVGTGFGAFPSKVRVLNY